MTDQDLRFMALNLASQFPEDVNDAIRLHEIIGELITQWLYGAKQNEIQS